MSHGKRALGERSYENKDTGVFRCFGSMDAPLGKRHGGRKKRNNYSNSHFFPDVSFFGPTYLY
jgi:hypothetical protein